MKFTISLSRRSCAHLFCLIAREADPLGDAAAMELAAQRMVEQCLKRELARYCKARKSQVAINLMDELLEGLGYEP
jgi:hypothetical protein